MDFLKDYYVNLISDFKQVIFTFLKLMYIVLEPIKIAMHTFYKALGIFS